MPRHRLSLLRNAVVLGLLSVVLVGCGSPPIGLILAVPPATSGNTARQLGENFARALAAGAAIHNSDFSMPSGNSLGGIYEHYNLQIIVAWSPDDVIVQGARARGANTTLRWTN